MNMRLGVLIGGLMAVLLCWSDVALAQRSGGVLRIFHRDNPPSASILEEWSVSTVVPFMPVFNNLVMFDQAVAQEDAASIVPELAVSWSWNDDKTELSFKLREGVTWHDGRPFTASDVECTFNLLTDRAREKLRRNPRAAWWGNINYVHSTSDYDLTIHLNRPQPSLLMLLASGLTPIYPCHIPPAQMRTKPIGTGPFKVDAFNQHERIRLTRNRDYWKPGRPYLDGIEFTVVPSLSTALLSFAANRFDLTFPWEVAMSDLADVRRRSPNAVCEVVSMNNSTNLVVNHRMAPFDDPKMRRALSLALDRKAFVDALNQGEGEIGGTLQPPADGQWGMPADLLAPKSAGYGPDVAKNREDARAIMARRGLRPGPAAQDAGSRRAAHRALRDPATLMIEQLREIYIEATLDVVETSYWFTRLDRKDYRSPSAPTATASTTPTSRFYENFSCRSERNYNGYCNPQIERMFEVQSSEPDVETRRRLVWDIDAKLLADSARPPLIWNRSATCRHAHVKGYGAAREQPVQRLSPRGHLARPALAGSSALQVSGSSHRASTGSANGRAALIGLGPPVVSPMARRFDISSRLAIAMPIDEVVNGTPVEPITAAPFFRLRSASGISAVMTTSSGPTRSAIQSSAASKLSLTTTRSMRGSRGTLM